MIYYTGLAMTMSGGLMTIAGIPTAFVYKKRIKNAVDEYNKSAGSRQVLTFSPSKSGIGIAMTF
jgi:hypothetical protein